MRVYTDSMQLIHDQAFSWDYFNAIKNGFSRKGETDEQKIG